MTVFRCEQAWLPGGVAADVSVRVADGVITEVVVGAGASGAAVKGAGDRLPGLVLPGFANAHSHAFHRALRGRTHGGGGTFWTWRDAMYVLASRLDPDSYHRLAVAVFAELAVAGTTQVGEFHYLHHGPDGRPYADPNAMGSALLAAAAEVGIGITLLDVCYLAGGLSPDGYRPLAGVQRRFGDRDVDAWAARVAERVAGPGVVLGAAVHSVRAVPAEVLSPLAGLLDGAAVDADAPVHVHLSEQPAENDACRAVHGCSPTALLAAHGLLSPRLTAVHATHVDADDRALLGAAGVGACLCPSTERDLADGLGPARELADAGCPLSLGTDQHALSDPLAEVRALEYGERARTGTRGRFTPRELVDALTVGGHRALGRPDAGRIAVGAPADLVAVRTDTVRTAGALPEQLPLVASAPDVAVVVAGGRIIAQDGAHSTLGDVGRLLAREIGRVWA